MSSWSDQDHDRDESDMLDTQDTAPFDRADQYRYGIGTMSGVRLITYEFTRPCGFGEHVDDLHQLTWAERGSITARVGEHHWVLPPTQAIWIPAGVPHDVAALRRTTMYCCYFRPDGCTIRWDTPTVTAVDDLLAGLLRRLARRDLSDAAGRRVRNVIIDLLAPLEIEPLMLPTPTSPIAADVARRLLERPDDQRTLDEWGDDVGVNGRTLQRAFVRETQLTFAQWRTQARLRAALTHLAEGTSVSRTAHLVGYRDMSGFGRAFRAHLGVAPNAFRRRIRA